MKLTNKPETDNLKLKMSLPIKKSKLNPVTDRYIGNVQLMEN